MTLYTKICAVLLLAATINARSPADKSKRGAETYATTAPKSVYATATPASAYAASATAGPAYSTKSVGQQAYTPTGKLAYAAQPVSYEQQQITVAQPVKVAYAHQPVLSAQPQFASQPATYASQPVFAGAQHFAQQPAYFTQSAFGKLAGGPAVYSQQQPSFALAAQPGLKYSFAQQPAAQPGLKYSFAQQPAARVAPFPLGAALNKVSYSSPGNVAYSPVAASNPAHYSQAGAVSTFSFNNPHVTYSNLGLLSQNIGKAYSGQQASAAPQVNYAAAPAAQYITAGPQQVAYVPASHAQLTSAPQIQYISAPQSQQSAHSSAQLAAQQGALSAAHSAAQQPQYQVASHQGSPSSPQFVYASPQSSPYSGGKRQYASPGVTYA